MTEIDKEMQEVKREVVEARNLVIKTDNLLKNLHADLKLVAKKQETFEKRSFISSATALILFAALAAVGAYMFAQSEIRSSARELAEATSARESSDAALAQAREREQEAKGESDRAFKLYERLNSDDEETRWVAVADAAKLEPKHLTALERKALADRSLSLRYEAAAAALDAGRNSFRRNDFRTANAELDRYFELSPEPEDAAFLLLGQARHAVRDYKGAVDPLETFLKKAPESRSADYVTLILGESLAEAGEKEKAISVYLEGARKYASSQWASSMRVRARRLQ